jgi:hypothetical protein
MNFELVPICVCGRKVLTKEIVTTEDDDFIYIHREVYRWSRNKAWFTLRVIEKAPVKGG